MRLFCFDLDGTITQRELLPLIAREVGLEHEFDVLTRLTIDGVISFDESLRLRFAILKTIPIAVVQNIIMGTALFPTIVDFIRQHIHQCYVVTGNLDIWIAPLLDTLGCKYYASTVTSEGDYLTRLDYIMKKNEVIDKLRAATPASKIISIGDGLNDYAMFEASDVAIAVGYTHDVSPRLIDVADYVVYEEKTLCRLLNML